MLSMTIAANADSPSSAIQMLDVNLVQRDAVGARNDCWDDAPMDARVQCAPLEPEHGYLSVVVTVGATSSTDIVVAYESMDLTATGGTDYVALDGSLTIAPGELTGSFRVDFIDDLVEEGNEEFVVKITPPEGVDIAHDYLHVTIIDEESIKITVVDSSEDEGHPMGMFVDVNFSQLISWPFSIGLGTTAGTAGPSDYFELDGAMISWEPSLSMSSTSGLTFRHMLRDDSLDEPAETYTLFIEGQQYLSMDRGSATMTIRDNDDPPSVSIADASGVEDSVGKLSFDVTLNTPSAKEITLGYATADDTATAASDYTHTNGTLTFSAGEITKTIDVPVLEDGSPEEDETFTVTLSNAFNATIGDGTGTGTIQDDDPVPTALSIEDVEGLESSDALEFPVTLTGDREAMTTVTVDYATSDGTGTAGSDYTEMSGTLTFATDMTRRTIRVPLLDDETDEPDETFVVTLSNSSGAMLDDSEATGTIRDNDATSAGIALTATPARVLEDAGATVVAVTATLDAGARTGATEVTVSVAGSGDADAVDFQNVPSFTITIAAGDKSGTGTFTLTPIDDELDESDETLSVTGTSDLPVTGVEVELADDDATSSSISLTAEPPRVSEGGGATRVEVTATLDAGARTVSTTVAVTVSGSGNADAVDFADVADFTIMIAAGDTSGSGTFTLTPEDDNVDESDETLNVDGSSVLPVTADTVALADDDQPSAAILLSASPGRISEDGGARRLRVRATLDASARAVATTVSVSVSGSGRPDAVDYAATATAFDITIAAGETAGTGTFTVTPEDDEVDERDEVLDIAGTSNLPVTPTSVTLADDEQTSTEILLSAVPSTVSEGAGATPVEVTATLDAGARTVSTTVAVTVSGSGNADAVDFADVRGFTITIAAGDTSGSGNFTLTPEDDNVDESDETLNVDGSSVLPVTADTVALADDDQPSAAILLSASPGRISEDGGARRLRVRATLDSSARTVATTVSVSVSGSGRPDAVDYAASATAFDITIAAGETAGTRTFTVTPEDDEVDERDEVLDIAGTSNLPVTPTSVTLTDDDQTSTEILLSAVPSTVSEGAGATPVEVTATLDAGARTVSTTVAVTVSGSGNADAVDFADVRGFTITIAAGDTSGSGTFTLTPEDDNVDESDETLNVDGSSVLPVTADTVALADDDQPSAAILLSASPGRISEDGGARRLRVRATLDSSARAVATTVSVSVSGSGRPDAVDYAATATAFDITIAAGETAGTRTFTVTPEDDEVDERDEVLDIAGTSDLPVTPTSVTLTDDEQTSTEILLSAVPSTVSEGAGATPVEVTATLDAGARTVSTTVAVTVSGSGNADAVGFISVRDFTITIAAGATSGRATFTLTPEDDNVAESSETVTVDGRSDIPVTQTSVTLTDDDVASSGIVLSASPSLVSEDGGAVGVKVTASLNGAARQAATTVSVSVAGSGNPRAVDFQAVEDFSITIAANAASGAGTFTLTPRDDATAEADETLTVSGASDLPVTPATVTLADDDDPSTRILLSAVPERVSEGDGPTSVTVTATLDRALRQQATPVTVTVSGSGDAGAADFAAVADFSITIPANAASGAGTFTLTPRDDATAEADETLTVSGASDLPVTPATVTLADDDDPSTRILLSAVPERVSEGDGPTPVTVTATLDRALRQQATTVTVMVSGSGDAGAADFEAVADFSITIPANAASGAGTFTLTPRDDATAEADETLTVSGASDLPVTPATVTLADDDDPSTRILLSAVPGLISEGDGPTSVTVTATLDRALRQQATPVAVMVSGSGDAGAADFEAVADFSITIPANAASGAGTFTLTPRDDATAEADETLTVSGASDLPVTPATVTLADDDDPSTRILLSAVPGRVSEGDGATPVTVTATLDRALRQQETAVTVTVSGSGDAGAVDFAAVADFAITIPANAASGAGTFTLTPGDDATAEADETLTVSGASDLPVTPATVTLADDDDPSTRILLSAVPERVSEGDGPTPVTVTATLDRALRQQETTVTVMVSGSGDAGAADFEAVADFSITIPANAASGAETFTLTPEDDAMVESNETLTVSGASDLPVTPAVVTLADDDEVSTRILLFLTVDPPRASEGDGEILVTVTAEVDRGVRPDESRIRVAVSGSGDPNAVDFAAVTDFEIVIPANARNGTGTFTVVPEDDGIPEADELLTISGVSDLPVSPATLELLDDDEASMRILLSADPARVSEGDGPVTVTVTASLDRGLRQEATTVTVSVTGGGDPNAVDFAAVTDFEIVIPANAPNGSGTFTVVPKDDLIVEADEVLTVSGVADLPVRPATMELLDDDEASGRILLSADPARVSEGDGPVTVTVTATLDRGLRQEATTVTVSVTGGGDPNAVDFAAVADFDIVIPANAPNGSGTFTVVPEDDLIVEADEVLTVSGVADLPVRPATMELLDDDEASGRILLAADPARVSEGDGPVAVTVTASLDRGLRQKATTVAVSVSGGGDADAVDFAAVADFRIIIAANAPSGTGTFTLRPEDDAEDEADETLTVTGESDLPVTSASVVLADDDEMTSRVLSIADAEAAEGAGEVRFAVTLDGPSAAEVTVGYATADPAESVDPVAGAGVDYESASGTLTFAPGEVSRTIGVSVIDDSLDEPDETFALVLADPRGATLGRGSALGTIRDDDEPPALSIAGDAGPEDVGELVFSVTLMARALTEVTVNYATMDDTAIAGDDYGRVEGTLTFALGETAKTIRVAVVDDAVDEADEEVFAVALSGPSGATLAHALATGVIRDDDEPPALSVADAAGDEDVGALEFAVSLSVPSGIEVSASYATADGTATAGGDYAAATGTLMFAPGEVSRTIAVSVIDDSLDEPDETFTLVLSDLQGAALGRGSALGTIRDDDEPPALSIAGDTGSEDVGELVFSVTLMARAPTEVTVNYATMDDTAIAGDDYEPVEGTLTFAPGETAKTIRVAVVDDALYEADEESFAVTLSGPSGATLAHSLATGVIRDDDEPPALSVADAAGDEDVGALEFAVKLSAPSGIEVSVSYATADGTATAGSDYMAATGTLLFAPGEVSQTIRVAVLDDTLHEADEEAFSLALSELRNATAADDSATGTIRDNDLAPPSVAGDLPAALLCVGGAPYELDLADYFDGKELRFSAVSSTPRVATATLAGSRLTVAPASEGQSSVTVTASNDAGSVSGSIGVRVVTDPAELEAVESVLASIGRAVLTGVTESVRARFDSRRAVGEQGASTNAQRNRAQAIPDVGVFVGNQLPGPPIHGTGSTGRDGRRLFEPQVPGDDWSETMNRTYRRGMVPFSFSLDSTQSGSTGPAWGVWGRADAHRFESGIDGNSHDGTLTAVHLGADARVGDWLAGVSVARSAADADYRFERSTDACGGGGVGDGMVDAELTSVHPYVGRQIGRGSVWATLGAGGGEVTVERCETGQRNEADLSMRLAALGGRHPFAGGERIEISVVEEIGVLDLTTGDAPGPVGDRSVSVGQARLGLEAAGVAPADCDCSLTTFVRAFARGDWGDGATGAGLELAAGVRFRNLPRRLGIDAGIRALAVHSAEDAKEHSANLTFSLLPKADGTGWQASLAWRRGASDARLDTLGGTAPWIAPAANLPGAKRHWIAQSRLGYGIRLPRGFATPFVELDAGHSERGGARFGVRHEFGDRVRGLVLEWGIEPSSLANGGSRILLEALGRF